MAIHSLNTFTGERILQRPTPRHLWATDRSRMCYQTCQQLPWCPAHGHTSHVASTTKKPIVIGAADVKKIQTTKKTRGSDMVAKVLARFRVQNKPDWMSLQSPLRLSLAMANSSSYSLEMPLLLSAISHALSQVICGQPAVRE